MKRPQNQKLAFKDRLERFAAAAELRASNVGPGQERDDFIRKAHQARTACEMCDWLSSPSLPPTV